MVLGSEGDKIKHISSPARDRKYTIVAYSKFLAEFYANVSLDTLKILVSSLVELCVLDG